MSFKFQDRCPMHHELASIASCACPKCETAPKTATPGLVDPGETERDNTALRLWVSAALTIPLVVIAMRDAINLPLEWVASPAELAWLELLLATPVVLWGGAPLFVRGALAFRDRHLNLFTPLTVGAGMAYAYSVIATLTPFLFPASFRDAHGEAAVHFGASAVIVTLILFGQLIELSTGGRTDSGDHADPGLAPGLADRETRRSGGASKGTSGPRYSTARKGPSIRPSQVCSRTEDTK